VNVARGGHVVTDDLVEALHANEIGGAGLDVTDPEPLPKDHPLWRAPRCIITPHTANTPEMVRPSIITRIRENVRRFGAGEPLLGAVDVELGY
jgi:phosphoglycerate dehydrogenase-like enzyme